MPMTGAHSSGLVNRVVALVGLCTWLACAQPLAAGDVTSAPGDPRPSFEFAPASTAFDRTRAANPEVLAGLVDLLHRIAPAAEFDVVLLGSVTPACATPVCPETLRLRTRVEALTQALVRAWPDEPGTFPIARLRWAFELVDRPDLAHRLWLRIARPPVTEPDPVCLFTVELKEPGWPPLLESGAPPSWLALRPSPHALALDQGARLRVRYHGAASDPVEVTWNALEAQQSLHAGPWGQTELVVNPERLPRGTDPRLTVQAPGVPAAKTLADTHAPGARAISDFLITWPANPNPSATELPAGSDVLAAVRCAYEFRFARGNE